MTQKNGGPAFPQPIARPRVTDRIRARAAEIGHGPTGGDAA